MNPLRWPFRAQFFLGFLICAGLLGYAIFLQLKMGLSRLQWAAQSHAFPAVRAVVEDQLKRHSQALLQRCQRDEISGDAQQFAVPLQQPEAR